MAPGSGTDAAEAPARRGRRMSEERSEDILEAVLGLLQEQGYDLDKLPYVVQYNKRDLPNAIPMAELEEALNPTKVPSFEAVAPKGIGVFDTLKAVAKPVLTELRKGG